MVIIDTSTWKESVINHYNDQDVFVSIDRTTINLEMSINIYDDKRKNEITTFKYVGIQYKIGSDYKETYLFY